MQRPTTTELNGQTYIVPKTGNTVYKLVDNLSDEEIKDLFPNPEEAELLSLSKYRM